MSRDPHSRRLSELNIEVSAQPPGVASLHHGRAGNGSPRLFAGARMDRFAEEEHLKLVQRVFFSAAGEQPRVVVFAGVDPGNGCSKVCRRTAEVLAGACSGSVCLVDADLHAPPSRRNGLASDIPGFTESLIDDEPVRTYTHPLEARNLWLLARGCVTPASSRPITSDVVRARIQELRQEFDRVLIDAPPLNRHRDAVVLAQLTDGLILVIEADATRRETALEVTESLRESGVKILGAVLNKRTFPIPERLYQRL